jgi:ParB-like nuclease family protein
MKTSESKAKLEFVSPNDLEFDPDNPRLGGLQGKKSQQEIQKLLLDAPHYASQLVDSLLENGFISYEPLVAKRKGNRFVLIEGNRRLAAVREILANPDRYKNDKDLSSIPVLVFPDKLDPKKDEVRVYLGVRHLFGFREWPPLSKASFLERECETTGDLDRVLREVRLTKAQARRFLVPFRLLKAARAPSLQGENFWVLGEALQRAGIQKYLQLEVDSKTLEIKDFNRTNLNHLLNDLYGIKRPGSSEREFSSRRVGETRDLSRLARVLSSEKAALAFRKGKSLAEAEIYVDTREESLSRVKKMNKDLAAIVKKLLEGRKDPESMQLQQAYKAFDAALRDYLSKHAKPAV